ncbi:amidohydrolase family protein [Streptantibioticus ferralitis]|uniref:Amidohydrolase family protein n=1 Tax=Streptantibioticus ferralitis TaxID=236510 RepID=A0ABT5YWM1_9ACTN|nr:amidohydrolase family protein [Streptantibioticus ferralitis]MDF2255998.1 amidohydrolase family protein [Streptantibioticus ferralitis]
MAPSNASASARTALTAVRVFDGQRLTEPCTVVIDGDVIGTDPSGARVIRAEGAVLLPGLIDAHVHLHGRDTLEQFATWGVTTGLDMATWPAELLTSLRGIAGASGLADLRSSGLPAIGPDGPHSRIPNIPSEAVVTSPEQARRFVADRVAEGADYIKAVAEAPGRGGLSQDVLNALVRAAREQGRKTVVHAASPGAYTMAVRTGADMITHIPVDRPLPDEEIARMKAVGQVVIPTLSMMEGIAAGAPLSAALHSVAALRKAGIPVLAGTDANSQPGVPFRVRHGESIHHELELLVAAGLSPVEALRAATVLPARHFGLEDRGAVTPGLRADLLLVDGDPTTDIRATRQVRAVWTAGQEISAATN